MQSYGDKKEIMVDPKKTYRGVPYFFGIDPVSIDNYVANI